MDLKDDDTKKFIQDIFQGKGHDVVKTVLTQKIDISLDLIKLGIEHHGMRFVYDKGNNITRTQKPLNNIPDINQNWIQTAAYSTDVNREEFIFELFIKYPYLKAITLLTLCAINIKKAVYWLKIIKEIDPRLISLKIPRSSPLVDDLCKKYECQTNDLFNTIIFANEESTDEQKIDKRLSFIIKSKANTPDPDELKLVYDERRRIIASGKLSPSQADKIFNALWDVNVEIGKPQRKRIKSKQEFQRDPFKFFRSSSVNYNGGRFIENAAEVKDLIYTLPYVSNKYLDRIKLLFDLLPIWDKKYKTVSECMYRFDEDQFFAGWEKLLIKESKSKPKGEDQFIFSSKGITKLDAGRKGRKQKEHYFPALEILDIMFADNYKGLKPLLLELIEHPSPLVREKVKELLSK